MTQSPGHKNNPNHKVQETQLNEPFKVECNGNTVAQSSKAIRVEEDGHPDRLYFPMNAIKMDRLEKIEHTTKCPYKGTATYYDIIEPTGKRIEKAAWSYKDPYEEHKNLKDRIAFHTAEIAALTAKRTPTEPAQQVAS